MDDPCPDSPEDYDGHLDNDGCPDLDNDRDGVPDGLDQCPEQKEDPDGWEDLDGCPDPDNDGDGIPDDKDLCPNAAETMNGYLDDDGCPDIQTKKLKIIIPPTISFSNRSTKLDRKNRDALVAFVHELETNPDLSLRIEAHVEPSGNAERDRELTQKQAESVQDILIRAGVAPDRIIAIGFGSDRPLESAVIEKDNRRVNLIVFYAPKE